jgi:hypothetical protein
MDGHVTPLWTCAWKTDMCRLLSVTVSAMTESPRTQAHGLFITKAAPTSPNCVGKHKAGAEAN